MYSQKETDILIKLGDKLRALRLEKKLSQAQLAYEIGTSDTQYQRIEYGQVNMGILTAYKLAEVFDIEISELMPPRNLTP